MLISAYARSGFIRYQLKFSFKYKCFHKSNLKYFMKKHLTSVFP